MKFRSVSSFALTSAIGQVMLVIAGFVVIRSLDKSDYALYAICVSVLGFVAVLSDSGINSALISQSRERLSAHQPLGSLFRGAANARRVVLVVTVPPSALLLWTLLRSNGAGSLEAAFLLACVIATFIPVVTGSLSRLALQIYIESKKLQLISVSVATVRLFGTGLLFYSSLASPMAFLAFAASLAIVEAAVLRSFARKRVEWDRKTPPAHTSGFGLAIRQTLPANLAILCAEQAIMVLLTANGNTNAIAEVAALSRFAMLFVVVNAVVVNLITPALAQLPPRRTALAGGLIRVAGAYLVLILLFVSLVSAFATPMLGLLGATYADLEVELVIISAAAAISSFSSSGLGALTYARGWNRLMWISIPLVLIWFFSSLSFLDLSSSLGAALLFGTLALVRLADQLIRISFGFVRMY
jgi:O-antigen/teichoic acid export membrane protein